MKKERTIITQELCDHVKLLLAGGATAVKAAEITKAGKATIYRIKAAGYDAEVYRKNMEERKAAEEPAAGQISMDELARAEEKKPEPADQTKIFRFQAGQNELARKAIEKAAEDITNEIINNAVMLNTKLDRLNDTLCMILRAIRKE